MAQESLNYRNLLLFIILVGFVNTTYAQNDQDLDEDKIDAIFEQWDQDGSPGCVVGIYQDGETVFSKGYGEAVLEDHTPITPETVFYVGSISKQFTAAAIALLAVRGELDLERPVRDYIPEISSYPGHRDPTVEELVHHTSGMPDLYSLLRLYDISLRDGVPKEELLKLITNQSHLNFEPGSKYMYSNSGYTLLAEIVERVSGKTLREYTIENLFEPLGMHHTHFHDDHNHEIDHKALSYRGKKDFKVSYISKFEGVGPGGLYSTIGDLEKWDQQLTHNQLPNAKGFNDLMRRQGVLNNGDTLSYAFALHIDEYKGQKAVGHGGSFMGFKADYLRLPEHGYGSAILCNLGNISPGSLNKKMADTIFEDAINEWIHKFEGPYYSEVLDLTYTLTVKDGDLYLEDQERSPSGKLTYDEANTFSTGSWDFEFNLTEQGEVKGFEVSTGRAKNIIFKKES